MIVKIIESNDDDISFSLTNTNIITLLSNMERYCYTVISVIIGTVIALLISKGLSYCMSIECNLLICSIAFLLIGFDIAISLFGNLGTVEGNLVGNKFIQAV
jgi:hypothetical protein